MYMLKPTMMTLSMGKFRSGSTAEGLENFSSQFGVKQIMKE